MKAAYKITWSELLYSIYYKLGGCFSASRHFTSLKQELVLLLLRNTNSCFLSICSHTTFQTETTKINYNNNLSITQIFSSVKWEGCVGFLFGLFKLMMWIYYVTQET